MSDVTVQPLTPAPSLGDTMSTILGLKQKQQALQTGQYTQQSAQADASMDTRKAQEQSRLSAYLSNPANKGKSADDMEDDVSAIAPTTGQDYLAGKRKNEATHVAVQTALTDLSEKNKGQAGDFIRSLSGGTHTPDQVHAMMDAVETINPQLKSVLDPLRSNVENMPPPGPQRDAGIAQVATMLDGKSGVTAGAQDTGPQILPTKTDTQGNVTQQPGAAITKALAPTQQLPYVAASNAASTDASRRAGGVADTDVDRSKAISAALQPSSSGIQNTQEVDDLAEQVHSGKFSAAISKAAAAAGMSSDTWARQQLEKDLGQVKAKATEGAGSDQRASTVLAGYPSPESDTRVIHAAMDQARGMFRQNLSRGDLLNKVRDKDPTLRGLAHADDTLTGSTTPLMHEFNSLTSKGARTAFYQRHFSDFSKGGEAEQFRNKVAGMGHDISQ